MATTKNKKVSIPSAHVAGSYRDRTRGCMVDLLDEAKVSAIAHKIMAAQFDTTAAAVRKEGWAVDGPLVIAEDAKAEVFGDELKYAIICTEGVGWTAQSDLRITVPLRCGWSATQDVDIAVKTLLNCRTGEQIDLADHVRAFGDRLESNFSLWFGRIMTARAEK